jgi:type 1 glutamine amidotransferase
VYPLNLQEPQLKVLFLGDNGHHQPRARFDQLEPVMQPRGIALTYTDNVSDLNPKKLTEFDAVLLYANIDRIEPAEEKALLDYVAGGGGFVPIHCASYCFRNSDACIALIGAEFKSHGWGRMRETVIETKHPVMHGYDGFESLDETYVHHKHNEKERTVLSYRVDGDKREPASSTVCWQASPPRALTWSIAKANAVRSFAKISTSLRGPANRLCPTVSRNSCRANSWPTYWNS